MNNSHHLSTIAVIIFCSFITATISQSKVVIAHRGASAYVPEHTLEGVTLAHSFGVDFIEPDVILTKDGVPIVMHDIQLNTTTDVASVFPKRVRSDGYFYAIDFTFKEIKTLRVGERLNLKSGTPVFPKRFPAYPRNFQIPSLAEFILLIHGLNKSTGKNVGIYPELKQPRFHQEHGLDITRIVYEQLIAFGYNDQKSPVYIQCFDPKPLKRIRDEFGSKLKLVQLISAIDGHGITYAPMLTRKGLSKIAQYADAIGPPTSLLFNIRKNQIEQTSLVQWAKNAGLDIHAYTVRKDSLPNHIKSLDVLHKVLFEQIGVDGVFSDFSDLTLKYLAKHRL